MNLVEKFIDEEKSKCNRLERLFNNYPVFYFVKDISTNLKHKSTDKTFIVRPSIFRRLLAILFICFGMFGWFSIFLLVVLQILLPITIIFLLLITAWIGFILWTFFLGSKYSFKITFTTKELIIDKEHIAWDRISEYLLMEKGGGRYMVSTLVLFIDNKEIKRKIIDNLNTSGDKILKLIELYKK